MAFPGGSFDTNRRNIKEVAGTLSAAIESK
jgi:hypothetical protein